MSEIEVTAEDREAANKAFDVAFQGNTDTIDDDMAQILAAHRLATEQASDKLMAEFANDMAECCETALTIGASSERAEAFRWLADALERGEHRRK